jgi:hypothetical protein
VLVLAERRAAGESVDLRPRLPRLRLRPRRAES